MTRRLRLIVGVLFFALTTVYVAVNAYRHWALLRHDDGWVASQRGDRFVITGVRAGGPADGYLREGDELVRLGGQPVKGAGQINNYFRGISPGDNYAISVRRAPAGAAGDAAGQGGAAETATVQEFTLRTNRASLGRTLSQFLIRLAIPLTFYFAGLVIFLLKPFDKQTFLLSLIFGMFLAFPESFVTGTTGLPGWLAGLMQLPRPVAYLFFAPVFLHFFLVFPETPGRKLSPLLRRFPRAELYIYAVALLFFVVGAVVSLLFILSPETGRALAGRIGRPMQLAGVAIGMAFMLGGLASLLVNYRQADELARRRMRIVLVGSLVGFTPLLLVMLLNAVGVSYANSALFRLLDFLLLFALPLIPLSFAYAIIRHKVIPVSLIIRRGVRYVLVSRGSVVLEIAVVSVVMFFLMDALFSRTNASGRTVGVISGVVAIVVWVLARAAHTRLIAPVIDRRFFRQSYNAQQVLSELGQALRTLPDVEEMCALVSTRMQEALQTENVTVFLREEATGDYPCVCSSRYLEAGRHTVVAREDLRLPREAFVVERLRESSQPLTVDFQDPASWTRALLSPDNAEPEGRRREGETLRSARAALLLPVATKEQLLGVISLGPRLGDLPFSSEDTQMLLAVSVQMAFALENAKLIERRAEEERLRRELEMATEVQRRIFPDRPPDVPTLELAGSCQPARGVGGDYYDFLILDERHVGVAVADVAGKGISAALLMSVVQASLRSQAGAAGGRLTELVASMNRLLNRSTGSHSYATFFYAQFDQETRQLTYVNAGHNPPLLVRARPGGPQAQAVEGQPQGVLLSDGRHGGEAGREALTLTRAAEVEAAPVEFAVEPLTTGGPVIGLFESFTYEQETVELRSGDLLVAYTDGLSEALNPEGEEFGEERLKHLVTRGAHLSAQELSDRIAESVRLFCRDAPQHDDLTLVVMKVK